jgi:hypothetical protein
MRMGVGIAQATEQVSIALAVVTRNS